MIKSTSSVSHWLIRISAAHRNLMRRISNNEGFQVVHLEIMVYLSVCNRYSDTTGAISEYLGQTKGSISQSLNLLEQQGFVKREQDGLDRRVYHLSLTENGLAATHLLFSSLDLDELESLELGLQSLLTSLQKRNGLQGFGICVSCKFNQKIDDHVFLCGLTNEKLTLDDTTKICREHEDTEFPQKIK